MLSLIELQNKKVEAKRKKYEKDEMDEYLEVVFQNYKELLEENKKLQEDKVELNKKMKTLSDGVQYYRSIETTLQKALILAEKTSKETKDAAILKAESIEKDAHKRADKIINNAEDEYNKLRNKCLKLAQQFNNYKLQLKEAASAQLQLIDGKEFDINNPEELDKPQKEAKKVEIIIDKPSTPSKPKHSEPIIIKHEKKVDSDTSRLEILSADTIDLSDTLQAVNTKEEEEQSNATPSVETSTVEETPKATVSETEEKTAPVEEKKEEPKETVENKEVEENKEEPVQKTEEKPAVQVAATSEVKKATFVEPATVKTIKPMDIKFEDEIIADEERKKDEEKPEETEKVDSTKASTESDSVPTLDSLLQDLNINNRSNQKSDDPFEFLGSVDDF